MTDSIEHPANPHELGGAELSELNQSLRVLARSLVGEDGLSEDLVQEAWLAALDSPARPIRELSSWLRRVIRNLAMAQHRRSRRGEELEQTMAVRSAVTRDAPVLERLTARQLLERAVAELAEPYRAVVQLRFFEELSVAEVAHELERSRSTVRTQLQRGIERLRSVLDRQHGGRSAWCTLLLAQGRLEREVATAASGVGAQLLAAAVLVLLPVVLVTMGLLGGWWSDGDSSEHLEALAPHRVGEEVERVAEVSALDRDPAPLTSESVPSEVQPPPVRIEAAPAEPTSPPTASPDATPPPPAPGTRRVELGVFHRDGRPAPAVELIYNGAGGQQYDAGAEGHLLTLDIPEERMFDQAGGLSLTFRVRTPEEGWSLSTRVMVPPEGRRFELRTGGPVGRLFGFAIDPEDRGLGGALVSLQAGQNTGALSAEPGMIASFASQEVLTDEEGQFEFHGFPIGTYELLVKAPGHLSDQRAVRVEPEAEAEELLILLEEGHTLSGQVLRPDGSAVAGALVVDSDLVKGGPDRIVQQAVTGPGGRFRLSGLGPGECNLFAYHPREPSVYAYLELDVRHSPPEHWEAILEPRPGLTVELSRADGEPAAGELVFAMSSSIESNWADYELSDADGRVHFPQVPERPSRIVMIESRRGSRIECAAGLTEREEVYWVELKATEHACSLRGVLLDAQGRSREGLAITAIDEDGGIESLEVESTTGIFQSVSLRAGRYHLWAHDPELGLHALGWHQLTPGAELDLGKRLMPRAVEVQLDWGARRPSADEAWAVRVRMLPDTEALRPHLRNVVHPLSAPSQTLSLLPGRYWIGPEPTEPRGPEMEFVVEPGMGALRVELPAR